jgi:hypothetical protein
MNSAWRFQRHNESPDLKTLTITVRSAGQLKSALRAGVEVTSERGGGQFERRVWRVVSALRSTSRRRAQA